MNSLTIFSEDKDFVTFAENKNITIQAKGLMLYLLAHANEDGYCDVTREQIMADMNIGKEMLNKYIDELDATYNIEVNRNKRINGRFSNNVYWINW